MRTMLIILFFLCVPLLFSQAPSLRGPEQVLSALEKSSINYELSILQNTIAADTSHKPNPFGYYQIQRGSILEAKKDDKKYNDQALAYFEQAEAQLLSAKNPVKARELYQKAINLEPDFYTAISGVGNTYAAQNNHTEAITWFKKAIAKNYMHSYTHRLLARSYKSKGMLEQAVKQISIALVLDRRHHSVIREFKEIYQAAGLNTADWTFTPQIRLTKTGSKKVKIEYQDPWLAYALAKAAWQYEPGFKEAAGVTANQGVTMIEEFECLYNLAVGLAKIDANQKPPALKALEEAVWNDMIYEYLFFEILLMQNPFFVFQIPRDGIEKVADYVINIRGRQTQ
jgi:tetratricopeptide (TPR) repeat protein